MKRSTKILLLISLLSPFAMAHADVSASSNSDSSSNSTSNSTANGTNSGTNTNIINFPSAPANSTQTFDYKGSYTVKSAPALYAPPLVTTMTDTCMGSSSIGASFLGYGFNGGTTWTDKNCVRRLDAREFRAMGMNDVAIALLCQNPDNRMAVEGSGRSCPGMTKMATAVPNTSSSETVNAVSEDVSPQPALSPIQAFRFKDN